MKNYEKRLGCFRTNCTLYYEYCESQWDIYKPEGKVKEDYDVLRSHSVLYAYETDEYIDDIHCEVELRTSYGATKMFFTNLEDLINCDWFDELDITSKRKKRKIKDFSKFKMQE